MKVGDTLKRRLKIYDPSAGGAATATTVIATVVYIHPERRYYVLRYDFGPGRSFREAYPFTD